MSHWRRKDEKSKDSINYYRNGGEGFIRWCEDFVCIPIGDDESGVVWTPMSNLPDTPHPETGRSYQDFWDNQKSVVREALEMKNGKLVKRLIIFCWPRGEGKSFIACLIQLWKFFCFPKQTIVLGANSKEQTKFVHFDIMCDIIRNSPKLLATIGARNIQEKEIRMRVPLGKDKHGNMLYSKDAVSSIRPISSFSGIVSNITGYTFSEIFDMKKPKFFTQLDGSIRNIPNALGVIDSTVAAADHILTHLHDTYMKDADPTLYFSYRFSRDADYRDYWHPNNTQAQLDSYKAKFMGVEFDRYFRNTRESGANRVFTDAQIAAVKFIGIDNMVGGGALIIDMLKKSSVAKRKIEDNLMVGIFDNAALNDSIKETEKRLWRVDDVYMLTDEFGHRRRATVDDLNKISQIYNTDWVVTVGVDRADPIRTGPGANTIITAVAKGLPNSRTKPPKPDDKTVPSYMYVLIDLINVESSELDDIKAELTSIHDEFGIDAMSSERWGMFDLVPWCEERNIPFEPLVPTYDKQREVFSELYSIVATGRFKAPVVGVHGRRFSDILVEEMEMFDCDSAKKWYGSPEKALKNGRQDDTVYSLGYAVYAGRALTWADFHPRFSVATSFFGHFVPNPDMKGQYA